MSIHGPRPPGLPPLLPPGLPGGLRTIADSLTSTLFLEGPASGTRVRSMHVYSHRSGGDHSGQPPLPPGIGPGAGTGTNNAAGHPHTPGNIGRGGVPHAPPGTAAPQAGHPTATPPQAPVPQAGRAVVTPQQTPAPQTGVYTTSPTAQQAMAGARADLATAGHALASGLAQAARGAPVPAPGAFGQTIAGQAPQAVPHVPTAAAGTSYAARSLTASPVPFPAATANAAASHPPGVPTPGIRPGPATAAPPPHAAPSTQSAGAQAPPATTGPGPTAPLPVAAQLRAEAGIQLPPRAEGMPPAKSESSPANLQGNSASTSAAASTSPAGNTQTAGLWAAGTTVLPTPPASEARGHTMLVQAAERGNLRTDGVMPQGHTVEGVSQRRRVRGRAGDSLAAALSALGLGRREHIPSEAMIQRRADRVFHRLYWTLTIAAYACLAAAIMFIVPGTGASIALPDQRPGAWIAALAAFGLLAASGAWWLARRRAWTPPPRNP